MRRTSTTDRLLSEYRAAIEPSPAQLAEVRARLHVPERRSRWAVGLGVGLAAAAAALVLWWSLDAGSLHATEQPPSLEAPHATDEASGGQWREASPPPPQRARIVPDPPAPKSAPPVRRPSTRSPSNPTAQPEPASLRLAAEARLIRTAESQLRQGEVAQALETLETHARTFTDGALVVERRALRSIALCRSGKRAQGRGEAAALKREPASHPYRSRIDEACK